MNASEALTRIAELIRDPTSNLVATAIGLAIVVLIVLIVVLGLLIWAMPAAGPKRKKGQAVPTGPPPPPGIWARAGIWFAVVLAVGSVAAGYHVTSRASFCTNVCHTMTPVAEAWKGSAHKGVTCIRCHEGRYGVSAVQGVTFRARSAYLEFKGESADGRTVPSKRCLECHRSILTENSVGSRAITMSHREVVAAGSDCADCHGVQGHVTQSIIIGMSSCLRCHDGVTAPAECNTCHTKGSDASIRFSEQTYGSPVQLPGSPTCGGCHSEEKCDACHGLRMPHPQDYADPKRHARPAAFDGKDRLCYRCHPPTSCLTRCHLSFDAHGGAWKAQHATYPRDTTWCAACHENDDMCVLCHR